MPAHITPPRLDDAELCTGLARLLNRLARKGALLKLDRAGTGYVVTGPASSRHKTDDPTSWFEPHVVDAARHQGWIAAAGAHDRLTERGAQALHSGELQLRAMAPAASPPAADDLPARPSRTRTAPPPSRMHASPPRRSAPSGHLLERLARLRDARGRPLLTPAQVEAGLRLATDFERGRMEARTTSAWGHAALGAPRAAPGRPRADSLPESASRAQERVRRAIGHAGHEFADLLLDVCCFERGLETVEANRGWPPRSARLLLGLALDRLTQHYGTLDRGPDRRASPTVWHAQTDASEPHAN